MYSIIITGPNGSIRVDGMTLPLKDNGKMVAAKIQLPVDEVFGLTGVGENGQAVAETISSSTGLQTLWDREQDTVAVFGPGTLQPVFGSRN